MMKNKKLKHYILIATGILVLIITIVIIVKVNGKEDTLGLKRGPLSQDEASELVGKLEEVLCINDTYPSYYGGAYLRNQNVVILITKDSREAEAEVREIIGQEEGVVIRYVKYSYNHLHEVQDKISDRWMELKENGVQMTSTSVRIEENEVVVSIKDISNRKIRKFKKLVGNYNCVRYEEGDFVRQ